MPLSLENKCVDVIHDHPTTLYALAVMDLGSLFHAATTVSGQLQVRRERLSVVNVK